MKKILLLFLIFNLHAEFTLLDNPKMASFEKELAYYFDVKDPEPVIANYLFALSILESHGIRHPSIKSLMLPFLESAYTSIAQQRNWHFDIQKAAALEYEIIIGNAEGKDISSKQIELYQTIYETNNFAIEKAVMIRSFIYKYKIKVLQEERTLSQEEIDLLLQLAKLSECYLKSLEL